ncbi:hypothetical protein [Sphingomonas bisphenolicum]|uniref:Uncharacterized protein n=1 Tax=Sphingomonas bisphenolicum TaxID=296544 RepID=A0ABM7FZJ9_9SPHN|nr:hypothetical protein [Sphingomonas bisphenolicum]BBF68395.1 hypothetical protein SBA_ch1_05950 [Sphingomonas bisphenolicum]
MNRFALYRFIAPFRSRLQSRLREERLNVDADAFANRMEAGGRSSEIAHLLWGMLREEAFVPDFRPEPEDSLSKVYAMGPEEVRDDLVEPLLDRLGLDVEGIDFKGFDFALIATPRDVAQFMLKIANT